MAAKARRARIAGRRGQMFVLTAVFMAGLIFVVQQVLFQYISADPRENFMFNEQLIVRSLRDNINRTAATSATCDELKNNIIILKNFVESHGSTSSIGSVVTMSYTVNCDNFGNTHPSPPPLNATIRVLTATIDSSTRYSFYHKL